MQDPAYLKDAMSLHGTFLKDCRSQGLILRNMFFLKSILKTKMVVKTTIELKFPLPVTL